MFRNKKNIPLPTFPDTVSQTIYEYLDLKEEKNIKKLQKHPFFYESCKGIHLLRHVAYGQQNEAEAILKETKDEKDRVKLLTRKADVTDPSGRVFSHITSFQYALWAYDTHMWKMLLNYMSAELATNQIKELNESGVNYLKPAFQKIKAQNIQKEKHFDFEPFLKELKYISDNLNAMSYDDLEKHWIEKIGVAQRFLPIHVVNEYCQSRSFGSIPTFKEKTLARKSQLSGPYFFSLNKMDWYANDWLGMKAGAIRFKFNAPKLTNGFMMAGEAGVIKLSTEKDYLAIQTLFEIRSKEANSLKDQLLKDELPYKKPMNGFGNS